MKKKKTIQQYRIVSMSLFILFFTACNKSSNPLPTISRSNQEFSLEGLEYVNVTPGKYLIYKDSASGILDSVVVTKSLLEKIQHPADTAGQYIASAFYTQEFSLTLTKVDGTLQTPWFTGIADNFRNNLYAPDDFLGLYEFGIGYGSQAFAYSTIKNSNYPDNNTIPSLTIEGNNYSNVIFGESQRGLDVNDPEYTKRTYYWAKGIGIIKRKIITTGGVIQTHTLVRHN